MPIEHINLSKAMDLPYSTATKAGNFIFISGQIGHVDGEGKPLSTIEEQTTRVLENLINALAAAGADPKDVVKTTIFLSDLKLFGQVNEVYKKYFKAPAPARSTVIANMILPEIMVEIEAIAYKP